MGNSSTKLAEKCSILTKDEVPLVASAFKLVSKNSDRIKEDDLMKFWGSQFDPRLAQYISNFLFGWGAARSQVVEFQRFAELYVFCTRGTIDERISVILSSLGQSPSDAVDIAYPLIKEVNYLHSTPSVLRFLTPLPHPIVRRGSGEQLHASDSSGGGSPVQVVGGQGVPHHQRVHPEAGREPRL